jgi:hypothetical protein
VDLRSDNHDCGACGHVLSIVVDVPISDRAGSI